MDTGALDEISPDLCDELQIHLNIIPPLFSFNVIYLHYDRKHLGVVTEAGLIKLKSTFARRTFSILSILLCTLFSRSAELTF